MPSLGVAIAVIHEGQVLLTQREDVAAWCLPGGGVEAGESLAQAAVRETQEETGVAVALTRLVGVYSRPRWRGGGNHEILFAAQPLRGTPTAQPGEVLAVGYFAPDRLPQPLIWWHRQRVLDALSGASGVARTENAVWPFGEAVKWVDFAALLAQSGLSRAEFFQQHFAGPPDGEDRDVLELADSRLR